MFRDYPGEEKTSGTVVKILLHICCAPCALYPLETLKGKGYDVQGLWYNPNIHLYQEYCRRRDSLQDYAVRTNLPVIYNDEYGLREFIRTIGRDEEEDRCLACYRLRLQRAAGIARQGKFDSFTTTLLSSPHQKHKLIRKIGEQAAKKVGVEFHYEDFREGNKESIRLSKEIGLYRQQYCGCIYSEYERFKKQLKV